MKPHCKCHNEPMFWNKDPRYPAGGWWLCVIKKRSDGRLWREKNKARQNEKSRLWREANPGRAKESVRRWQEAHTERVRELGRKNSRNRRGLKLGAGPQDYQDADVFALTDGWCIYQAEGCTGRATDVEHIVSLSNGGRNQWGNVVPSCRHCNRSKWTMDLAWIQENAPWLLEKVT